MSFNKDIEITNNRYSYAKIIVINDGCFNETLYEVAPVEIILCADSKITDLQSCYEQFLHILEKSGFRYATDDEVQNIDMYLRKSSENRGGSSMK